MDLLRSAQRLRGDNDVKVLVLMEVREPVHLGQQPEAPQHASCEDSFVEKLAPGKDAPVQQPSTLSHLSRRAR